MSNESKILRRLASDYFELLKNGSNAEKIALHTAVNDLHAIRPVVLIDELPWSEMNLNDELTLYCSDPELRSAEWFLRSNIYKYKHLPADMILQPFLPIRKVYQSTGIGIEVTEKILHTDQVNNIVSHQYQDILATEEDLEKLRLDRKSVV